MGVPSTLSSSSSASYVGASKARARDESKGLVNSAAALLIAASGASQLPIRNPRRVEYSNPMLRTIVLIEGERFESTVAIGGHLSGVRNQGELAANQRSTASSPSARACS